MFSLVVPDLKLGPGIEKCSGFALEGGGSAPGNLLSAILTSCLREPEAAYFHTAVEILAPTFATSVFLHVITAGQNKRRVSSVPS